MKAAPFIARGAAIVLLLAVTIHSLEQWVLLPLRCMHAASNGQTALEMFGQRTDFEARRQARRVHAELEECECVSPPDARIPTTRGAAAEMSGDLREAITDYQRALLINRRPEIYFRLGLAQLDVLDHPAALGNLTRACAFDPQLIAEIPYRDVAVEIRERLRSRYGQDWIR